MSTDTTTVRWFDARAAAAAASETAGPFLSLATPADGDEIDAARLGVAMGSIQHGSDRAQIDMLAADLAIANDKVRKLVVRGFREHGRGWSAAADLLLAAAQGQSLDVVAFAQREAAEMKEKARMAEVAAIAADKPQGGINV